MLSESAAAEMNLVSDEERLRANVYRLLARFLSKPPTEAEISSAAALTGDDTTSLGRAVHAFSRVAGATDAAAADDEFHALFIGVGRGELLPYASYYLNGFLHEKPLARLRDDMAELGISANLSATEPEDHAAAVLDMMAGLITGGFANPSSIGEQRAFFEKHISSWMPLFFRDLEGAKASILYAALAQIGSRFLEIESAAFGMSE